VLVGGFFAMKLQRDGDGRLEGTYEGRFRGKTVSGPAEGTISTREYVMGKNFVPVQPGEHPRTVFRKSDLSALREKLETPFGRAVFPKMSGPVGWGVQYQLTGDKKYAETARKEVAEIIYHGKGCSAAFAPARALGVQVERVAVSYDLCYDAWPEQFKSDVVVWLRKIATRVISDPRKISHSANWSVCSNHVGSLYGGVAFSGLVLWGEKGPAPPKPTPITAELDVPPAEDYRPPSGVPVVPLEPGVAPKRWPATEAIKEVISTADALFAIVDKIDGGRRKVWLWQVPKVPGDEKHEKIIRVDVDDNTFTVPQGEASLHATFAAPSPVKLVAGTRSMEITISAGHKAGQKTTTTFDAVFAEGGDDFFFVVATLQQGDPPPVKVVGKGLGAKVYVGKQVVTFDGEKVVFGR